MMREPYATISNIAYLAAAFAVLEHDPLTAGAFAFLAFGSGAFHATGGRARGHGWAQSWDEIAMYVVCFALASWWARTGGLVGVEYASYAAAGVFAVLHRRIDSFVALPMLGILLLGAVWARQGSFLVAAGLGAVFMVAYALRAVGEVLRRDAPLAADALHSVWHVLTACGLYCAFTLLG